MRGVLTARRRGAHDLDGGQDLSHLGVTESARRARDPELPVRQQQDIVDGLVVLGIDGRPPGLPAGGERICWCRTTSTTKAPRRTWPTGDTNAVSGWMCRASPPRRSTIPRSSASRNRTIPGDSLLTSRRILDASVVDRAGKRATSSPLAPSETGRGRESPAIVRRVAERHLGAARSLQEEPDVVLVGHPDTAVHLNGLVRDQQERVVRACLGHAHERLRRSAPLRRSRARRSSRPSGSARPR